MHGERIAVDMQRPPEGNNVHARLNWLVAANTHEAHRLLRFRHAAEEEELLLMRRPLDRRKAFALFGLLLGLLPPAAIFIKMFGYGLTGYSTSTLLFIVCLAMNCACAGVGYAMGGALEKMVETAEGSRWSVMMFLLPLIGMLWGAITGFAGGLIFVGIGAYFGAVCAIPVGALAFTLFGPLHRLLSRGGMIDARHFWPLATGATAICTALVLGL